MVSSRIPSLVLNLTHLRYLYLMVKDQRSTFYPVVTNYGSSTNNEFEIEGPLECFHHTKLTSVKPPTIVRILKKFNS